MKYSNNFKTVLTLFETKYGPYLIPLRQPRLRYLLTVRFIDLADVVTDLAASPVLPALVQLLN